MWRGYQGLAALIAVLAGSPAVAEELQLTRVDLAGVSGAVWTLHPCPGDALCLIARTAEHGWEPWVVDADGPRLIADLRPGPESSDPTRFVSRGGAAWFAATTTSGRRQVFRYDGERLTVGALLPDGAGTVRPLSPLGAGGAPHFVVWDRLRADAARPLADIVRVGPSGAEPLGLRARLDASDAEPFDGGLWLSGTDAEDRGTLWFFDERTLSVVHQTGAARVDSVQVAGGRVLFTALGVEGDGPARRLYASDGRRVWEVAGVGPDGPVRQTGGAAALGDDVYVVAEHVALGREVFRLVDDRLEPAVDLRRGEAGSNPESLTAFDGALWFQADGGGRGAELWRYDGRTAQIVVDLCPGTCGSRPRGLLVRGDALWFVAADGAGETALWRLGPPPRPRPSPPWSPVPRELRRVHRAVDLFAPEGASPTLSLLGGRVHFTNFAAVEGDAGWTLQPWRVDEVGPALTRTTPLAADAVGAAGFLEAGGRAWIATDGPDGPVAIRGERRVSLPGRVAPSRSARFGDFAVFVEDADAPGLFAFDGRDVVRIADAAGAPGAPPGAVVGGAFYFVGRDPEAGAELHAWDGSEVRLVVDLQPGPGDGVAPADASTITGWRDAVWFVGSVAGEGRELVRWDGSATAVVTQPGPGDGALGPPVVEHDVLWFPGRTEATGAEPFVVMSPDAVPRVLTDLSPGPRGSAPSGFTAHGGGVYFAAEVPGIGRELFRVPDGDGKVELVLDLSPGAGSSAPRGLVSDGEDLWFVAVGPEGPALHRYGR